MTILSRRSYLDVSKRRGFTLVELLVAVSLSVTLLAVIYSTFLVLAKGAVGVGNYSEMSQQSRIALDVFSNDARAANGLIVASKAQDGGNVVSTSGLTFTYPDYLDSGGAQTEVAYVYTAPSGGDSGFLTRAETYSGTTTSRVVLQDMNSFKLKFFQAPGASFSATAGPVASVDSWAKSIQLDAELKRKVVTTDNTDYIISARFMMRNTSID